jgi:hypothetical protein
VSRIGASVPAFLERAAATPVVWGRFDCHLWLADWVKAAVLYDPAPEFRGRYTTPRGALRVLRREGGSEAIVARLAERGGFGEIDPARAQRGDIGLIPSDGPRGVELIGALCTGPRWAMLAYPVGIAAVPANPVRAWRII